MIIKIKKYFSKKNHQPLVKFTVLVIFAYGGKLKIILVSEEVIHFFGKREKNKEFFFTKDRKILKKIL